jgi:hypothetical protein
VTNSEMMETIMRLRGEGPLQDGEGLFILQGKNGLVVRGGVLRYQMTAASPVSESEFHIVLVGATVTHHDVPLAADTAIGMKLA